ncbi:MAG: pyrroloquinoline quinone-dependent dehydrogenase [Steroidobacteraceae bacterium]
MNHKQALAIVALAAVAAAHARPAAAASEQYGRYCAECHHLDLRGSAHGAALRGAAFTAKWSGRKTGDLAELIRTSMAMNAPSGLSELEALALAGYLAEANGAKPTDSPPAAESVLTFAGGSAQDGEASSWEGASGIAEAAARASRWRSGRTPDLRPVTQALLDDPPPGSWLNWRRTASGHGHSPLDQVKVDNVGRLKLAWAMTMREGSNQVTPIVHDGVMFLTHPGNVIQALDAGSGELIWEYSAGYPEAARTLGGPTRNLAIYGDKIFLATYDAALVALDMHSGREVWRTVKADYRKGYTHTAGPVVVAGVLISGINGCERFKDEGCFVTGHDPETGRELWRTQTIAQAGDPNDASWAGVPPMLRGGGDNWIAGSYDPVLGLYYLGTSQAKPWVAASRGMSPSDAALYTNSTLALDPATGRIAWYFQHVPGETLDMETGFERVLVDLDGQPSLLTVGKDGLLWKLDRRDGGFLAVRETLPQTLFEEIDFQTGKVRYRQDILDAGIGDTVSVCPSIYGGHNWQASAYSPDTRSLIIPLHQLCVEMTGREVNMEDGGGGYGGESRIFPLPGSDGQLGRLSAYDASTLEERWTHTQAAMFLTGVLTTSGGLAFVGDLDRYFNAFDVTTGERVWRTRLGAPLHGYPVSYLADGKQYVAVATGMGVFKLMTAELSPDIYQPSGGNMLYVFTLAD